MVHAPHAVHGPLWMFLFRLNLSFLKRDILIEEEKNQLLLVYKSDAYLYGLLYTK